MKRKKKKNGDVPCDPRKKKKLAHTSNYIFIRSDESVINCRCHDLDASGGQIDPRLHHLLFFRSPMPGKISVWHSSSAIPHNDRNRAYNTTADDLPVDRDVSYVHCE